MLSREKKLALCMAGLLHDVGKFRQRAEFPEDKGLTHGQIGYEWLKQHYGETAIEALGAVNHHATDEEVWSVNELLILYEADNCSASERRTHYDKTKDVSAAWHRQVPLACVFSRVRNPHEEIPKRLPLKPAYWHLPSKDGLMGWHPPETTEKANTAENYKELWKAFTNEFDALRACGNHRNPNVLLHLLEKYTGVVPSITLRIKGVNDQETYRKHPDISLFDHLKTTAAFAVCLAEWCQERYADRWEKEILKEEIAGEATWAQDAECPFLLVGGDLSGVQRFIYTISSKGALKSLKGRSFFLELFLEHAVDSLLEALELFRCHVIFTGGGHFYLVAPNTPKTAETLRRVSQRLNDYLFRDFNGALELFLRWVPFRKADLRDVTRTWTHLSQELEEAKKRKGEAFLKDLLGEAQEPHPDCYTDKCQVCGREDRPLDKLTIGEATFPVCDPCYDQYNLGNLLQQASRKGPYPVIYRWKEIPAGLKKNEYISIDDRYYQPVQMSFNDKSPKKLPENAEAVYHLNDWDLTHYTHKGSRPLFAAVYVPPEEDFKDLESMAKRGFGIARIGVLRMDVDRLGRVFSLSLPEGERTFSLTASLSRHLSLFFKFHLNGVLRGEKGYPARTRLLGREDGARLLTVVYSGGDDLFLIGHWLDVLEAALDIQRAFSAYTANPYLTVSAGLALGGPHEPVYRLADAAGEAEDRAKADREENGKRFPGRKAFCVFGNHTFPWHESTVPGVGSVLEILGCFEPFLSVGPTSLKIRAEGLSKSFYYKLLQLVRLQRRDGVWMLPKLAYLFGRTRVHASLEENWLDLRKYMFSEKARGWRHVEMALVILLMMMREGDRNNE
ncbi:MAG: type III-A CRISPR-associated protein Cas10/Csm1 [Desulfosoma sp.]